MNSQFRVAGLSFWRIFRPVLILSLIITAFCFITYDKLIPFSSEKLVDIKKEYSPSQYIYTQKDENGQPTLGVVISRFNYSNVANVVVLDFSEQTYTDLHALSHIFVAKHAQPFANKWVLQDVVEYHNSNDGIFKEINHMKSMDILQASPHKMLIN